MHLKIWHWKIDAIKEGTPYLWRNLWVRKFDLLAISEEAILYDSAWLTHILLDNAIVRLQRDFPRNSVSKAAHGEGNALRALLENNLGDKLPLEGKVTKTVARWQDHSLFRLLLARRGDEVHITRDVVEAAAENLYSGKEIITLLLDKRSNKVHITSNVVEAATENWDSGKEVMVLLLDKRSNEVHITSDVVKAAAGNYNSGKEIMALLLDKRGDDMDATLNRKLH